MNESRNNSIMSTLRILVADDSVAMRRLLSQTLSEEATLEVCYAARDGRDATTHFPLVQPDVVVLDVEMPIQDGFEATIAIRKLNPHVPIIMFSSPTKRACEATLDALSAGATDFVTKPSRVGHLQEAIAHISTTLVPMIKYWGNRYRDKCKGQVPFVEDNRLDQTTEAIPSREHQTAGSQSELQIHPDVELIAIGASSGGPSALANLVKLLPKTFAIPILIVQHMPVPFMGLLAKWLSQICELPIREATDGAQIEPGQIWIAPGDQRFVVEKQGQQSFLKLNRGGAENSSFDALLRSVAATYRERALAVVLTGRGADGKQGCQQVRDCGGTVIIQDEATSVVWEMPEAVASAGFANGVLPLPEIAQMLARLVLATQDKPIATH